MQLPKAANLTETLPPISGWEFGLPLLLMFCTAMGSIIRLAFNFGYNRAVFVTRDSSLNGCCINFLESYLIPITLCLCVGLIGLWLRRAIGFYLALLALTATGIFYLLWYRGTLAILRDAELTHFSLLPDQPQKLLPLYNATWWDLIVLAVVLIVIVWLIKILVSRRRSLRNQPESQTTW